MYKVKCIKKFLDKKEGKIREIGDEFTVNEARLNVLTKGGLGKVVEVVREIKKRKKSE